MKLINHIIHAKSFNVRVALDVVGTGSARLMSLNRF